ncbi:MAG: diadenylate cyclase CdaA, partial [Deferribacterota bacterium]|nr:diadenylate cyclase CdaA [Deferribacterota bacterium]
SNMLKLTTTSWLLDSFTSYLFLILIIVFQPEFRRVLAALGEPRIRGNNKSTEMASYLDEIIKAVIVLANRQIGALIVIERNNKLDEYIQAGTKLDAVVSRDILISIFIPYSPLHDGAVIVSNNKILYAASILPLTKIENLDRRFGTRHRAAIGITEETDAVCIVVSEERGSISISRGGKITTDLDIDTIRDTLNLLIIEEADKV